MNESLMIQQSERSAVAGLIAQGTRGEALVVAILQAVESEEFIGSYYNGRTEALRLADQTLRAHGLRHEAKQIHAAYIQKVNADE